MCQGSRGRSSLRQRALAHPVSSVCHARAGPGARGGSGPGCGEASSAPHVRTTSAPLPPTDLPHLPRAPATRAHRATTSRAGRAPRAAIARGRRRRCTNCAAATPAEDPRCARASSTCLRGNIGPSRRSWARNGAVTPPPAAHMPAGGKSRGPMHARHCSSLPRTALVAAVAQS